MIDSDNYNPSTANNSYSNITILNAKNEEVCEETKNTIAKVYTQDFKLKHEDRFLFGATTMSNLYDIKRKNPKDIFTVQLIIPPNMTIDVGYKRLLENTMCQISHYVDVIVFGGTIPVSEESEDTIPYDYKNHKSNSDEPIDLAFMIGNIIQKIFPSCVRFSHFGVNEHYNELLKIKDYALLKNNVMKSFDILDNINNVSDNTRYEYNLRFLCNAIFSIISKKKIDRVELLVSHKKPDLQEEENYNSFKEATEQYGYNVMLENNRFIVEKK